MSDLYKKYGSYPLYGKRILHVLSPVRWKGNRFQPEMDSNWKVMEDTIEFLPMCHHYILVPGKFKQGNNHKMFNNSALSKDHPYYNSENVTFIPFPYPQSVLSNRIGIDSSTFKRIFDGRVQFEFRPNEFCSLRLCDIDIDFIFCHQPELLSDVLWSLMSLRYGMNNTDGINFFHWIDCPESSPAAMFPPTFFRHMEAVNLAQKSFVHGKASLEYWKKNWEGKKEHVVGLNEHIIKDKLFYMPLKANDLPQIDGGLWNKTGRPIAFNHRWNATTGRNILPEYMKGLSPEYVVYSTDKKITQPFSGFSPVSQGDLDDFEETDEFLEGIEKAKGEWEAGRFKYAYEGLEKNKDKLESPELYADFLRNCYASVGIIKGYGTWNLSVQDPIKLGTPTLVYDTPMMRDVLGSEYPFYFKTKDEFQKLLQNLPEKFEYPLRDFKKEFRENLHVALLKSRNVTKFHDQEGIYGRPWLYFMSQGLTYKKDMLYQTHQSLIDSQGSNSWETIRRWVMQYGIKDDPTSMFTKLHIPDDATQAHKLLEEYLKDDKHKRPYNQIEKWSTGKDSKDKLITHKNSPSRVRRQTGLSDLSSHFGGDKS